MKRPKTGGRQKGTPNKKTVERQRLLQSMCPPGDDPMTFWAHILRDKTAPLELRHQAARELAPFVHPKLSSIESRTGGATHEERLEELRRLAEDD